MHAFLTSAIPAPPWPRHPARGFTLIELMTVLVIAAILIVVGAPMLAEFVADQRVRTVTSDIVGDFAFARVKAIERSRPITIRRTGVLWRNGWTIFEDVNRNGVIDVGETIKVFDGFSPGNMYVCSDVVDFATDIVFRPDGRVVRITPAAATNGIYVVDTLNDAPLANNKIRAILFGTSGRATVIKMNGTLPIC